MNATAPETHVPARTDAERGAQTDDSLLAELKKLWQDGHRSDVSLRHLTGAKLNTHFGPPTVRQSYGPATLKTHAENLGVAESDLSRMRWFAHHFKSVDDLRGGHPDVTTWTQVKVLLATLAKPKRAGKGTPDGDHKKPKADRPARRVIRALRAAREGVVRVGKLAPDHPDRKALNKAVEALLAVAETSLGFCYRTADAAGPVDTAA